jgi:sugar phosphate isomerase/epimerase
VHERPYIAETLADKLHTLFSDKGIQFVSLATFLPEIASPYRALYEKAQDALLFLVDLASHLKARGHPLETIEIVGGSLIRGVECRGSRADPLLVAKRLAPGRARRSLLTHLKRVAASARRAGLSLALELEPGPLYIFHSRGVLVAIERDIHRPTYKALHSALGFNLDAAHWAIAHIDPAAVLADADVCRRVVHSHIADHGPGHLGDVGIGICNSPEHVYKWLYTINGIAGRPRRAGLLRPTRRVSIEMECVSDTEVVELSSRRLKWLLGWFGEGGSLPAAWPPGGDA